jgi:hypothetical protein
MGITLNRLYTEVGKTQYTTLIDYNSHSDIEYVGYASPSSSINDSSWRILKLTYYPTYDVSSSKYANGVSTFTNKWSLRESYIYA